MGVLVASSREMVREAVAGVAGTGEASSRPASVLTAMAMRRADAAHAIGGGSHVAPLENHLLGGGSNTVQRPWRRGW